MTPERNAVPGDSGVFAFKEDTGKAEELSEQFFAYYKKKADTSSIETMVHFLYENGLQHPEKPAYEWYDPISDRICHVTYEELMRDVAALGSALYSRGFRGSTAALIGRTGYPWVLCFLTSIMSDMIIVPLDPDLGKEEMDKRLRHCRADAVFLADELVAYADVFSEGTASGHENRVIHFSDLNNLLAEGESLLINGFTEWLDDYISEKQRALMIFTSGTGGKMKAAVIRQENLMLERFVWQGIEADQSKCHLTLPLYHIAGIGDLRGTILTGTTAYLGGGLRYLLKEYAYVQPRTGFMVPAPAELVRGLLLGKTVEEGRKLLGGRFVAIRSSGAHLTRKMRDFFNSYGIDITSDYGMTETCGPVSVSVMKNGRLFSKPGSAGRILDSIEVKIDHPDELGHGEILISGPCVFDGYFEDPEETGKVLKDGWLYTGDIGYVDEDRYLYIVGRKKNVIITQSGENVIPEELEENIRMIPGVKECLVYEKDGKLAVKIFAKDESCSDTDGQGLKGSILEGIRRQNGERPTYKRISITEFTDAPLPKTSTGKIKRNLAEK